MKIANSKLKILLCALFLLFSFAHKSDAAAPTNGLVGYWNFDEGSGTTASDSSGSGNNGTLVNGPTWTMGKVGGAVQLDGVDDKIIFGDVGTLTNFTVAFWFKTTDSPTSAIVGLGNYRDCRISYNPAGGFSCTIDGGGSEIYSGQTVNDGIWRHATYIYTPAQQIIYIDGAQKSTASLLPLQNTPNYVIVGDRAFSGTPFAGLVDDLRIYSRALSAQEVLDVYSSTGSESPPPPPPPTPSPTPTPPPPSPTPIPPPPSGSRTFYIDYASGSDSSSGISKTTPWKRAPGMQGCTATCASITPQAGDHFIFKGGVIWDHNAFQMNINWSGTSGNPIYFGVDTTWYAGGVWTQPIFSGDKTRLVSGDNLITVNSKNYITLDNIEFRGHMAYSNWGPGSITHYCSTYLVMQNLFIHDWHLDVSLTKDDAHGGIIGNYPGACRPTGNIISHSVISNIEARDAGRQNGVAVRLTDIEYSTVHDVQTAQLFGLVNNSEFYNVSYPDLGRGVSGSNQGFDPTPYHENNTYVLGWDGTSLAEVRPGMIYNNVFHDISTGSGAIYPNNCPVTPFYIFNNVAYNIYSNSAIQIDQYGGSGTCGEYHIWNNTFQTPNSNNFAPIRQVNRGVTIKILDVQNNHFIHNANANMWASGAMQINNNNIGQTNSIATSLGYTLSNKYAPPLGGVTVSTGANLTESCVSNFLSLCRDTTLGGTRVSVPRPSTGPWDIGAYQFSSGSTGSPPPATPTAGDLNLDHIVNTLDFSLLNSRWNQNYSAYDLYVDGTINSLDFAIMSSNWGKSW